MVRVLYINTPPRNCGVHTYGENIADALAHSTRIRLLREYLSEGTTTEEYLRLLTKHKPDYVLYNYHPQTMAWLDSRPIQEAVKRFPTIQHLSIAHDYAPQLPHLAAAIHLDPTFEETFYEKKIGRVIHSFTPTMEAPANVIGTFGYASRHKNFPKVVDLVNKEFDQATIRIHMPRGSYVDPDGRLAEEIARECRALAKPGITVEVTNDYKTIPQLIEWLSQNTVNCFLYEYLGEAGISSAIDYSLAARRPIAVSDSHMFRHLLRECPGVRVATRSLKEIIADGFAPLERLCRLWSAENLVKDFERIFDSIQQRPTYNMTSNRVLSAQDREEFKPVVEELRRYEPGIMSRKFPGAVFQNAFVFEQVRRIARRQDRIILIGGYEDPIGPSLRKLGYNVRITDPAIDGMNARDVYLEMIEKNIPRYDIVVSCSVIEHVEEDELFIHYLYSMLKPGGTAVLTTDYNDEWRVGMHKPDSDVRIYNAARMRQLAAVVPADALLDAPTWGPSKPYFEVVGAHYGFCSLAFFKPTHLPETSLIPTNPALTEQLIRSVSSGMGEARVALEVRTRDYQHVQGEYAKLDQLLASVHQDLSTQLCQRNDQIQQREADIAQRDAEIAHRDLLIAQLQADLNRFGGFKEAGPQAIGLVNAFYRLARMTPRWMRGGVKRWLGLMRNLARRLRGGTRASSEQTS